jgi:single-stranded DNA-binding protein
MLHCIGTGKLTFFNIYNLIWLSNLYVEGKIRTDKYTDTDGNEKQLRKIRVISYQMIEPLNGRVGESHAGEDENHP